MLSRRLPLEGAGIRSAGENSLTIRSFPPRIAEHSVYPGTKTLSRRDCIRNSTGQFPTSSPSNSTGTSSALLTRNRRVWKYSTSRAVISEVKMTFCKYLINSNITELLENEHIEQTVIDHCVLEKRETARRNGVHYQRGRTILLR